MNFDEENNNVTGRYDETENVPQDQPEPAAPEEAQAPEYDAPQTNAGQTEEQAQSNAYDSLDAKTYKETIKRMKQEYKQFQKDQKRTAKAAYEAPQYNTAAGRKGVGAGTSFVLSLLTSFIVFVLIFGLIAFFPSKEKSFLASLYRGNSENGNSDGQTNHPSGNDVQLGDHTISKGDDVTINITGDSAIAQAVYAKAANSVVGIAVSRISGSKWNQTETTVSMGSGIIYSADGIIVTNYHVIEDAVNASAKNIDSNFSIRVYFKTDLSEWAYVTELIGYDQLNDVAVIRVDAQDLQPIEFADSDTLTTGETAITIGSPGGISYMNSISEGILSGLNRTITTNNTVVYDLIQTTAAINPGNSGGALLNKEGKLIGLCVIKIVSTEYEGMGFAINSNTVKTIVESIRQFGYYNKPLLGVTIDTTYSASVADRQGWKRGAYVQQVSSSSCSANAGIKADDIITKINDAEITSFEELRRYLLKCNPGETVTVEVYRSGTGKTLSFEVVLDETKPD